jgi:hypothetical protein
LRLEDGGTLPLNRDTLSKYSEYFRFVWLWRQDDTGLRDIADLSQCVTERMSQGNTVLCPVTVTPLLLFDTQQDQHSAVATPTATIVRTNATLLHLLIVANYKLLGL